jgi:hypothetical protein
VLPLFQIVCAALGFGIRTLGTRRGRRKIRCLFVTLPSSALTAAPCSTPTRSMGRDTYTTTSTDSTRTRRLASQGTSTFMAMYSYPEIFQVNDFTLGGLPESTFRLRSKKDPDLLKCEFCGLQSSVRCNHNAHLSVCKKSTVPCKPGYMCDTCGFIAGTGRHLRDHLDTHNDPKTFT